MSRQSVGETLVFTVFTGGKTTGDNRKPTGPSGNLTSFQEEKQIRFPAGAWMGKDGDPGVLLGGF